MNTNQIFFVFLKRKNGHRWVAVDKTGVLKLFYHNSFYGFDFGFEGFNFPMLKLN
jgi:hypothetical protein